MANDTAYPEGLCAWQGQRATAQHSNVSLCTTARYSKLIHIAYNQLQKAVAQPCWGSAASRRIRAAHLIWPSHTVSDGAVAQTRLVGKF